jgi:hypothetical protein
MAEPPCDRLDEYLCGWLTQEEAARFEAHLAACSACQEESACQRQIDRLLAEAGERAQPVPASLVLRIRRRVQVVRRRLLARIGAVAALAAAIVAIGLWASRSGLIHQGSGSRIAEWPITRQDSPEPPIDKPTSEPLMPPSVRVVLADPSSAILVPVESRSPNVTVVWVYPTSRINQDHEGNPPD